MKTRFGWALASAVLLGSIGSAYAADMAVKARPLPPAPVVYHWTGFYVGGNVGGIWSDSNGLSHTAIAGPCNGGFGGCTVVPNYSTTLAVGSTFNTGFGNNGGFTGGGQVGYNWQFGGGVAGFEADIGWTDQRRSVAFASTTANPNFPTFPLAYTATISRSLDYLGTVRGRLGFLAAPSFLLYGTGGLAYGGTRSSTTEASLVAACAGAGSSCAGNSISSFSDTRVGWTAGVGGEWMFAPNWSAKAEFLYYDLGRVNYATAHSNFCNGATCAVNGGLFASATGITSIRYDGGIGRFGINYHFNGPVVARY